MLIDKETGFALIYNATYKFGNETIPGIYISSFEYWATIMLEIDENFRENKRK